MTKQAKTFRSIICGLVSFLLSLSLTLLLVLTGMRLTALNPKYAVSISQRSNYAEYLHEELKEKYVSYGNACNVDESFFDTVFTDIISVNQIKADTSTVLTDFYNNDIKTSIDTSKMDEKMLSALKDYAVSKGYSVNDSMIESLQNMVEEMSEMYNSYISLFSSSYFVAAAGMLSRYMPLVNYGLIAFAAVCIISIVIIRLSFKKAKNYTRYYIYAGCGSTLMLLVGPVFALIRGIGGKISIGNKSLYYFASTFINNIFVTILILALVVAIITALLVILRSVAVKSNK